MWLNLDDNNLTLDKYIQNVVSVVFAELKLYTQKSYNIKLSDKMSRFIINNLKEAYEELVINKKYNSVLVELTVENIRNTYNSLSKENGLLIAADECQEALEDSLFFQMLHISMADWAL